MSHPILSANKTRQCRAAMALSATFMKKKLSFGKWIGLGLVAIANLLFSSYAQTTNTNRFGFTGPEIFPVDNLIGQMRCADFDGDGKNDLVVANNARSKI